MKSVTEYLLTPFGYPHPYKLGFVAQYRFVHQVGEFLVRRDDHQQFVGGLAHSWTIAADRKSITFHLRPGLYSASEAAQSLRRLLKAGQTSHSNLASQTTESDIRAIDDSTLEIRTKGDAGAVLPPLVMADAAILPDDHWISVPGFSEPQVDWRRTKGPYIYSSGEFPLKAGETLEYRPNPSHYLFDREQLKWRLTYHPLEQIENLTRLDELLRRTPSFATIRYWDYLKLFSTPDPGIAHYETRPNGIAYILPNLHRGVFKEKLARLALLKRILNRQIPLLNPQYRADQIAQPGLSGRMIKSDLNIVRKEIEGAPDHHFSSPLIWTAPEEGQFNSEWTEQIAQAVGLPYKLKSGPTYDYDARWKTGDYDLMIGSVGMSDTDPISGATFLFSPSGLHADLPNGEILKVLNEAKGTSSRELMVSSVQKAFRMALENALLIPVSYVVNRHYHSAEVELNIQDPFTESVRIWEVRLRR